MDTLDRAMPKTSAISASREREPKYMFLRRELLAIIGASKPGDALPSYTQMIRKFGVGQATIDRVLREFDESGLIVRQGGKGIFISQRAAQRMIGLVFGRNIFGAGLSPICSMVLQHCERRAASHNENFKAYLDLPRGHSSAGALPVRQELLEDIQRGRLDGMLLFWEHGPEEAAWLRKQSLPLVSFGGHARRHADSVCVDYTELVKTGVKVLAARGCRRLALMTPFGYLRASGYEEDKKAFLAALQDVGLKPHGIWEDVSGASVNSGGSETHEEQGYHAFQVLFEGPGDSPDPKGTGIDGILSLDDMLTRGALAAARSLGVEIGRDVQVATHANKDSPVLQGSKDSLILLELDVVEIVETLFEKLEALIEGRPARRPSEIRPVVHLPDQRVGRLA